MGQGRMRDKARTRNHIAEVATRLFTERGFDEVTVAEVAAAAEVSKVTVFAHFPRKEDLLLDRLPEAVDLAVAAVRDREPGIGALDALRRCALDLADRRHPLTALSGGAGPFLNLVIGSADLRSRVTQWRGEIEHALARALADDGVAEPALLAALIVAAYSTVVLSSVAQVVDDVAVRRIAADQRTAVDLAFDALDAAYATISRQRTKTSTATATNTKAR